MLWKDVLGTENLWQKLCRRWGRKKLWGWKFTVYCGVSVCDGIIFKSSNSSSRRYLKQHALNAERCIVLTQGWLRSECPPNVLFSKDRSYSFYYPLHQVKGQTKTFYGTVFRERANSAGLNPLLLDPGQGEEFVGQSLVAGPVSVCWFMKSVDRYRLNQLADRCSRSVCWSPESADERDCSFCRTEAETRPLLLSFNPLCLFVFFNVSPKYSTGPRLWWLSYKWLSLHTAKQSRLAFQP